MIFHGSDDAVGGNICKHSQFTRSVIRCNLPGQAWSKNGGLGANNAACSTLRIAGADLERNPTN